MLNPKAKMRINLAVKDYIEMFPEEYAEFLTVIEQQRHNLDNEMGEIKATHAIERGLATYPEKLFQMIQKKLDTQETAEFKTKESQYWFLRQHPAFALTKHI